MSLSDIEVEEAIEFGPYPFVLIVLRTQETHIEIFNHRT